MRDDHGHDDPFGDLDDDNRAREAAPAGWSANGRRDPVSGDGDADRGAPDEAGVENDDGPPVAGGWVQSGGVVRWEGPDDEANPRAEIDSPLAADEPDLPPGAPAAPRVRAVHAWMMRQRAGQEDALGSLLLAQREQGATGESSPPARRRPRRGEPEPSPLDLAIAEHRAAADEYDALLTSLDEQVAHGGAAHALVEFYLWLGEHLADLAGEPEAAGASSGPPATLPAAAWLGRAQAALAVRTRVERVTAPESDE
jgi:hypothetical protein